MKTEKEITSEIARLKDDLRKAEQERSETHERITGVKAEKFCVINENFISVKCETLHEMKNVISNLNPFKNGWKITDGIHITSLYRVEINNSYHSREFKISFENASGCVYWVSIDFNNLPEWFKEVFFISDARKLYQTESHYVSLPFHYKKVQNMRIPAFSFPSNGQQISFYGGDKVCCDETLINEIIEEIKNIEE